MNESVLFRADSGPGIGSGHLMRCLALAQRLHDSGRTPLLATAQGEGLPLTYWRHEGADLYAVAEERGSAADASRCGAIAADRQARWVVVDGYGLGPSFQRALHDAGLKVLVVDDLGGEVEADIVVNPNAGAEDRCRYDGSRASAVLLGARFVMLRREVREVCRQRRTSSAPSRDVPHILVTFGGDDRDGRALEAIEGLLRATGVTATVVCTAGPAMLDQARRRAATGGERIRVTGPTDLAPLIADSDVALSAGGHTALELAAAGVPAVLLPVAENQEPGSRALAAAGCALLSGRRAVEEALALALDLSHDRGRREHMAARGRDLVDGGGVDRVADALAAA